MARSVFLGKKRFDQCEELLKEILHEVRKSKVNVEYNGETIAISFTASFGLYYFKPDEHVTMEKGYLQADQLLLQSKQNGRDRVTVIKAST